MKKVISLLLALSMCAALGITSFATDSAVSQDVVVSESVARFQRTTTKTISSTVGIYIDVTYTFNDSNNAITGVQKTVITKIPSGYANVTCAVSAVEDDCAIITVAYKVLSTGKYESESLYVFAG